MSALGVKFFVNMESLQDNHDIDKRVLELSLVIFNCGLLSAIAFSKANFEISQWPWPFDRIKYIRKPLIGTNKKCPQPINRGGGLIGVLFFYGIFF